MSLNIVILAAGQGKRMNSTLPKILHCLAHKTLLEWVTESTTLLNPASPPIVIYGHQGETVRNQLPHLAVTWVEQQQQLGTGHAVLQALPLISSSARVLILYGDVPLITQQTLRELIDNTPLDALGIITAHVPEPKGLGRIVRNAQNNIMRIAEEKDATAAERALNEINSGIYLVPARYLQKWLPGLKNNNAQQEFYLTDIIQFAVEQHIPIHTHQPLRNSV